MRGAVAGVPEALFRIGVDEERLTAACLVAPNLAGARVAARAADRPRSAGAPHAKALG